MPSVLNDPSFFDDSISQNFKMSRKIENVKKKRTTALLSGGKVTMPNVPNTLSDGYRVTAAQFAVKAIANTPRSPRFLLVSDPEAPIAGGRNQQKNLRRWLRRTNREAVWRDPSTRSDLSRAQFYQMIEKNREIYAYKSDALSVAQVCKFVKTLKC